MQMNLENSYIFIKINLYIYIWINMMDSIQIICSATSFLFSLSFFLIQFSAWNLNWNKALLFLYFTSIIVYFKLKPMRFFQMRLKLLLDFLRLFSSEWSLDVFVRINLLLLTPLLFMTLYQFYFPLIWTGIFQAHAATPESKIMISMIQYYRMTW